MIKKLITLIICVLVVPSAIAAYTTKTVCHNVKNTKTGKIVNQCKQIKVHKKFNGTKVPTTPPATKKQPQKKK